MKKQPSCLDQVWDREPTLYFSTTGGEQDRRSGGDRNSHNKNSCLQQGGFETNGKYYNRRR